MRRAILAAVVIALLGGTGALASGCGKGAAVVGAIDNAAASASPAPWAKVIELGGSLSGAQRGRSNVTVALTGSALRFDLTYGSAPGWGADHARVRWWLYRSATLRSRSRRCRFGSSPRRTGARTTRPRSGSRPSNLWPQAATSFSIRARAGTGWWSTSGSVRGGHAQQAHQPGSHTRNASPQARPSQVMRGALGPIPGA